MGVTLIRFLSINMNVAKRRVNMQIFSETCQRCGGDRRISLGSLIVSVPVRAVLLRSIADRHCCGAFNLKLSRCGGVVSDNRLHHRRGRGCVSGEFVAAAIGRASRREQRHHENYEQPVLEW